jgi:hypothetical protein
MSQLEPDDSTPDASQSAEQVARISLDFEDLETGDLEDMEAYCGPDVLKGEPVLGVLQEAFRKAEGSDNVLGSLMAVLPTKLLTALLGVFRRHQDPAFGPERWREIKLAQLTGGAPPPSEPAPPTPISRARTGKRDGQRGNAKRTRKPT